MAEVLLCLHVKTWTWLVAIVNWVLCCSSLGGLIYQVIRGGISEEAKWATWANIAVMTIWFICVFLLVYALCENKPVFIIPHMIITTITGFMQVFAIVMFVIKGVEFVGLLFSILTIVLILFFIFVEYQCYTWMKEYAPSTY